MGIPEFTYIKKLSERQYRQENRGKYNNENIIENWYKKIVKIKENIYDKINNNTIKINQKKFKEKFNCQCGGKYTYESKSKHLNTQKHQKWVETQHD